MKRSKRLIALIALLVLVCGGIFALQFLEEKKEQIRISNSVILDIPSDSVTAVTWTVAQEKESTTLSFRRTSGIQWAYEGDAAFPVSPQKMQALLAHFEDYIASFAIEGVEDISLYGLKQPVCVLTITAEAGEYTVRMGGMSPMDQQRYIDIGDGNVYLVPEDPFTYVTTEVGDLLKDDKAPDFDTVTRIAFEGISTDVILPEAVTKTYDAADLYYCGEAPMDTEKVEAYLDAITGLNLKEFATYKATAEELAGYGLTQPELTVCIDYRYIDLLEQERKDTFLLHIGSDQAQLAAAEQALAEGKEATEVTRYARFGASPIVYVLPQSAYDTLITGSADGLRHEALLWAEATRITAAEVELEGKHYRFTCTVTEPEKKKDEPVCTWTLDGAEVPFGAAVTALLEARVSAFGAETPLLQREIAVTVELEDENVPSVRFELYRYNGSSCIAVVDGQPLGLVPRSAAMGLVEAVQAIVLC